MKKLLTIILILCVASSGFSQVINDHRKGKKTPFTPDKTVKPQHVVIKHQPGPAITTIDPGKWYYIKKVGTEKYMEIDGHKDLTKSYAKLAIEEMQQDNTSQQWQFVSTEVIGSTIYKLKNKKYGGYLYTTPSELYMEFRREANAKKDINTFLLVLNPDKSWYILTRKSGNKEALSIWRHKDRHCVVAPKETHMFGPVPALFDYECSDYVLRDYVRGKEFVGENDQKWILEEVPQR